MKASLLDNAVNLLGTSFEECHCSGLVSRLMPGWKEKAVREVPTNYLVAGDILLFGESAEDLDALVAERWAEERVGENAEDRSGLSVSVGVYLGNGKVVVSTKETGVCLFPFRFARMKHLRGFRVG